MGLKKFKLFPENTISRLSLLWVIKLLNLENPVTSHSHHEPDNAAALEETQLKLSKGIRAKINADTLQQQYADKKNTSLLRALAKAFGYRYILISLWKIGWAIFLWAASYFLLKEIIRWAADKANPSWLGHTLAAALFFCCLFASMCFQQLILESTKTGFKCRSAIMVLIYRKSLKLSYCTGVSDIVNLISIDCNRVAEACVNFHFLWSAIFECVIIATLTVLDIGVPAVPSLCLIFFFLLPVQFYLSYKASLLSYEITLLVTKRVHLMSEIITAIKLIKFYAWEKYYFEKVKIRRAMEIKRMKKRLMLKITAFILVFLAPTTCTLITLITYYYMDTNPYDSAMVFSLLSLFNTLRYPLLMLPMGVRSFTAAKSSIKKLEDFFSLPEIDDQNEVEDHPHPDDPSICMEIKDATFKWDGDLDHPHIADLSLTLRRSQIAIIVGELGSGKSLIACIMGQLKRTKGSVLLYPKPPPEVKLDKKKNKSSTTINKKQEDKLHESSSSTSHLDPDDKGTISEEEYFLRGIDLDDIEDERYGESAEDTFQSKNQPEPIQPRAYSFGYVPQEPWLIDSSLRDNIVFGKEWDEEKYSEVVRVTGLLRDIMVFQNGDLANVNDLNLTGAQRQRLSLARCLYHDPDIILLEDCFSDFDTKSASTLFKQVIQKYFLAEKGKCVVYYTQQKQFLPDCDVVLVMKNGVIIEQGTYKELKARKVNFSTYISEYTPDEDIEEFEKEINDLRLDNPDRPSFPTRVSMLRNTKTKRSSPLSTSTVINNLLDDEDNDIPLQPIRTIEEGAEMHADLISTIIEKNQLSILNTTSNQQDYVYSNMSTTAGGIRGVPPSNFANQDSVTRTIQVNSLTIHHVEQDFYGALDEGTEDEQGENQRKNFDKKRAKSWYYYDLYLKERTGRILGIIVIVSFFVVHGLRFGSDVWIGLLVRNQSSPFHLGIYGVFSGAIAFGILVSGYIFSNSVLQKSVSLHNRVFKAVLRAPIAFYDATPIGQILSNFAKHVYVMDEFLPEGWLQVLSFAPIIVGTVLLISVIMPWFGVTLPIYFFLVWFLVSRCTKSAERLKALEASNKAPMFSHLSTTLEGLFSIRLYYCEELFDTFNQGLIDADNKALHALMAVKSFQSLYLDLISTLFIYSCALYVVLFQTTNVIAGLALSNALQLLLLLQWFVRTSADVHGTMFSVSSVVYFGNQVPTEGPAIIKDHRPVKSWPSAGEIEFRNLVLKYNRYGVSVLKNVSFTIRGGEKIGVVGKSGSGKTTLLVSLLRITEPSEGSIHIDGLDISSIGLQDLRSKIAVIPQEPVLFTGTVRTNLDSFDLRSDEEVWKSLRSVHLSVKIEEMPAKLDTPVTENGKAFTMAERQLFCIARAILMHTKIVVLDEPLVAVDKETDRLIQQTIKENFTDHTVIVLASRFNLIMGADRIIVMEKGRIVEFDTPLKLLNDPRSKLIKMINNAADVDVNKLKMLAEKKEKERPYKYSVPCKRQGSGSSKLPTLFNPSLKSHYVKQHGIVPNVSSTTESDGEFDTISRSSSASSAASMPKSLENIFGEANNFANPLNKKKE